MAQQELTEAFTTIAAARRAGFHPLPPGYYGGEQIEVKGQLLARNPLRARSKTEWAAEDCEIRDGEEPHAMVTAYFGKSVYYAVFRHDQVEARISGQAPRPGAPRAKRPRSRPVFDESCFRAPKFKKVPPKLVPLLDAVWALNRRAKRMRDSAKIHYHGARFGLATYFRKEKDWCYNLKGQALHWLLQEGGVAIVSFHRFSGDNWAKVVEGGQFRFHFPCPESDVPREVRACSTEHSLGEIEAKARSYREPRFVDALYTIEQFLLGRTKIQPYRWLPREWY